VNGGSRILQEYSLSGIGVVAGVVDEAFGAYYPDVMPMLKKVMVSASGTEQRSMRGKTLELISLIRSVVDHEDSTV
jgi:hypothetical protein